MLPNYAFFPSVLYLFFPFFLSSTSIYTLHPKKSNPIVFSQLGNWESIQQLFEHGRNPNISAKAEEIGSPSASRKKSHDS